MNIVIWYNITANDNSKQGRIFSALSALLLSKKHKVKNLNPSLYNERDGIQRCDIAFVWSFAYERGELVRDYIKAGIPIIVVENGYFDKEHFSFGINKHYYIPKYYEKNTRFEIEINSKGQNSGDTILFVDRGASSAWFEELVKKMPADKKLLYRPHPHHPQRYMKNIKIQKGEVDWNEIFAVVTDMSAFGNEAIKNRVPVFCKSTASYAILGNVIDENTDFSNPVRAKKKDIEDYFDRIAYTQYSIDELDDMLKYIAKELDNELYY